MDPKENFYLSEEDAEWVGLKKSEYLSKLIQELGPTDFGFEEYHKFDHLIHGTIESPDRSYTTTNDKKEMRIFLKTYLERPAFHQVVIGVIIPDKAKKAEVFVPVLIFVTKDEEVVKKFCTGEAKTSPVLN